MGRIRGKNTTPEMVVRRAAHRLGLRFRIHLRDMPGTPDIVLRKHGLAIFVHGCFWHRHEGCRRCTTPKTRTEFWNEKFRKNVERDQRDADALRQLGWKVLIIWECQTKSPKALDALLIAVTAAGRVTEHVNRRRLSPTRAS
jgi:DNA mismatch endonuclease (patch repair protein)